MIVGTAEEHEAIAHADQPGPRLDHELQLGEKAIEYLTLFARRAATLDAHEEAVRALQEAELHVQSLPHDERDRRRLDLVLRHASSLFPLGRLREILDLLLPQREPLERLNDAALAGHYHFRRTRTPSRRPREIHGSRP